MAELLKCTECRGTVSSSADKCPHCKKIDFRDKKCAICKTSVIAYQCRQYVDLSIDDNFDYGNVITVGSHPSNYGRRRRFYCNSCWERLEEISMISCPPDTVITCEMCGNQSSVTYFGHNHLAEKGDYICSNCGHKNIVTLISHKVSNCHICHRLLNQDLEIRVNASLYPSRNNFIHQVCFTEEVKGDVERKEKSHLQSLIFQEANSKKRQEEDKIRERKRRTEERDQRRRHTYQEHVTWAMWLGGFLGLLSAGFIGVIIGPFVGQFLCWLYTSCID
jgi:hypothetical protein